MSLSRFFLILLVFTLMITTRFFYLITVCVVDSQTTCIMLFFSDPHLYVPDSRSHPPFVVSDSGFNFSLCAFLFQNCGVRSGLFFLQHVGILPQCITVDDLYSNTRNMKSSDHFYGFDYVCEILRYKFTSVELLTEAFTHHSCFPNSETECHQKLAFLGEAMLGSTLLMIYNFSLKITFCEEHG